MSIRYGSLAGLATAALVLSAVATSGEELERKGIPAPPGHVFQTIISGYQFRTKETRALQDDDLENPGFLAVERAADVWKTVDGGEGKSCMSCHGEAEKTMKGVGAAMPKWSEKLNKPVNLEQQINICRTEHMKAEPWAFKSKELTDMTTFVRFQSRGLPVAVKADGPMSPWFEKGKEIYYTRVGQLDLACASCHEKNNGKFMRADFLSQGQTNGFPTYRLRDQRLIPLHERFEGCMFDVRGVPYKPLSDEFLALELYVAWRGIGLPVETPSVRNQLRTQGRHIMISRREFVQVALAAAALTGGASLAGTSRAFAQQKLTEKELLAFDPLGNVTLVHVTDIHGQLMPLYFREPSTNLGVGDAKGQPPHVTGKEFLTRFGIAPGSSSAYALTSEDFEALAKTYGRIGGLDRAATVIKAIRAERGDKVALLDGGDTWQGSWSSLQTRGQDMIDCMALLKPDAMTGHWEFTYGTERVKQAVDGLGFPFLGLNIRDTEWNEPAFEASTMIERGGVKIAVLGQAFPYTPVANPRWMIPNWSFGVREEDVQTQVDKARKAGAGLVVLLSHNGFDVDRKLASRVKGLDVILTGHTHDALPEAVKVGKTLLIASGSSGKFVSRLDLDVKDGEVKAYRYRLIPLFSDVITPDTAMAAKIAEVRKPFAADLGRALGRTETLLYRRGNFNGTFDDLICQALLQERDAEIALSPGFRWGTSVMPGQDITFEDVTNATAITYPAVYRMGMTGTRLKEIIEDVADNLFNVDPYYQQGGDMVRIGGMSYAIDVNKPQGQRISDMRLIKTGAVIDPAREYQVAGWASVNEGTQGPPIWEVVSGYLQRQKTVRLEPNRAVKVSGV